MIQRFPGLQQQTLWERLKELKIEYQRQRTASPRPMKEKPKEKPSSAAAGKAPMLERQLAEILLADPELVPVAVAKIPIEAVTHPGLRKLIGGLYELHAAGEIPDLDALRTRLDHDALVTKAMEMQDVGRSINDRPAWLERVIAAFAARDAKSHRKGLRDQLSGASDEQALELLRRLQNRQTG